MEQEFLSRFYSTQCTVSMTELTNTKQWKDEPVSDYINNSRALSLECKDWLSEALFVEMCAHGMAWDLLYVLQMSKPLTFQELATRAHDMEITIANHCDSSFSVAELINDRAEFKKNVKFSTSSIKVVMTISKVGPVQILGGPNPREKRRLHFKDTIRRRPTLKELQE